MTHTYTGLARSLALQESMALRGYARWGIPPSKHSPIDYWGNWIRQQHVNGSSFGKVA